MSEELDPRLLGWLKARRTWPHVLLDQKAVEMVIAVLEDLEFEGEPETTTMTQEQWDALPDHQKALFISLQDAAMFGDIDKTPVPANLIRKESI